MISSHELSVFHAVAEAGSISRGAERLYVSQPAVSKQISEMESRLGAALFERLPRGVRLTEAGRLLQEYAKRSFALSAEAEQALADLQGLKQGTLTVGASLTIGVYLLPEVFGAFHRRHPGITLDLEIANSLTIQRQLLNGGIDIALIEGGALHEGLQAEKIGEDELVAVTAPGYTLSDTAGISIAQLCQEPFVLREAGSGTRAVLEHALAARGLTARPVMTLGSTEAVKRAVAAGIGVAFISRLALSLEIEMGRLSVLTLSDFSLRRPLHRLRRVGGHESRAVSAFTAELRHALFESGLTLLPGPAIMTDKT